MPTDRKLDERERELESIRGLLAGRGIELRDEPAPAQGPVDSSAATPETAERTLDSMSLFLAEVRRHGLLTRAEEIELAKQIERSDLAAK